METKASKLLQVSSLLRNRVNLFYFLAFLPLFLIFYFNIWSLVIGFYGFIFLLLKNQKLQTAKEASFFSKILGLITIASSFFVYYALVLVIPSVGFYGGANYIVFLFGLFLVFFEVPVLKEGFTALFFVAAATSTYLIAELLEPYFSPYLGNIANILVNFLRVLGVDAQVSSSSSIPTLVLMSLKGNLVVTSFEYGCLGVFSALVFSILLVVLLVEDPSSWKIRLLASTIGILGVFTLNLLRVTIILLTDYFYGAEVGATVHYIVGYALF